MREKILWALGAAVFAVLVVWGLTRWDMKTAQSVSVERVRAVLENPAERAERGLPQEFIGAELSLTDSDHHFGGAYHFRYQISREGAPVGQVRVELAPHRGLGPWPLLNTENSLSVEAIDFSPGDTLR